MSVLDDQRIGTLETELGRLFAERGWSFSSAPDAPAVLCTLAGPLGQWTLFVHVVEDSDLLLFYAICPVEVRADRRPRMAELLVRVNYGLSLGSFELDFDDGEVRAKIPLVVEAGRLDADAVERIIRVSGRLVETFLPAIRAVASGVPPERALAALART